MNDKPAGFYKLINSKLKRVGVGGHGWNFVSSAVTIPATTNILHKCSVVLLAIQVPHFRSVCRSCLYMLIKHTTPFRSGENMIGVPSVYHLKWITLIGLSTGTPKTINFPNGKLMVFRCPNIQAHMGTIRHSRWIDTLSEKQCRQFLFCISSQKGDNSWRNKSSPGINYLL